VDTPLSLLDRLLSHENDEAWQQFNSLYDPLIRRWVGRLVSQFADIEDIVQDVLEALLEGLPQFRHNGRTGAFRTWLRLITIHRVRRHWRDRKPTAEQISQASDLEDPRSGISRIWDEEHDRHVLRSLLDRVRPDFDAKIWGIFERIVFEGCSAREIARDLGCTTNVVFIAKARVLKRLRLEARGLFE
jgi:RNA polymerase sigma-70 factor (ECF subfamily)